MLHFLVEYVERDFPELLSFEEEILHLDPASRISVENIKKVLKQMDNSIKNLETDLKNAARTAQEKDDRYAKTFYPPPMLRSYLMYGALILPCGFCCVKT